MRHYIFSLFVLVGLNGSFAFCNEPTASFRNDIAPILLESCSACHCAKKAEGGYRIDSYDELLKAGDSGNMPIAKSADQSSELLRRVTCQDPSERMPAENDALPPAKIELIKSWIASGAKFDGENPAMTLFLVIPPAKYSDPPESYSRAVPIAATVFSMDGQQVVVGGYHELTIWSTEDSKLVRRIKNIGQRVFALARSADGQTLAVCCGEPGKYGEVRLVNFKTGEIKGVIARSSDVALDVAFRPGSAEVAVASADSLIRIINTDTLAEVRTIASHADWVTAIAWSDDGTRLASASRDKSAKVYDANSGELLVSYLGHGAAVRGVSILADGKQIVSTGADSKLHRWDIEGAKKVAEVALGGEGYKVIRSDNNLFVPCADQKLKRIDLSNNKIAQEFQGHGDWVLSAAVQPATTGTYLASGSFDGEVRLWNAADGSFVRGWSAKP